MSCCAKAPGIRVCAEGKDYVAKYLDETTPRIAVAACEGACTKGEVARVAANLVGYRLARNNTVRICLGDAITASSGFDKLIERSPLVIVVEGCPLCCGTALLRKRFAEATISPIVATKFYDYDRSKFEIFDLDPNEILENANQVAPEILSLISEGEREATQTV